MNPEILTLSIISLASGTVLGYLIGIVKHLAEQYKSEKNFTLPLV
jgi:hypothetical protein